MAHLFVLVGHFSSSFLLSSTPCCCDAHSVYNDPEQSTTVDDRLGIAGQQQLIRSLKALSLAPDGRDVPVRPSLGTIGTETTVRSNFFKVTLPRGPLFEYDVKITPAVTAKRLKRRLFDLLEAAPDYAQYKRFAAHDGSAKLITSKQLPQPLVIKDLVYYDEDESVPKADDPKVKTFTFEFNFVQELRLDLLTKYVVFTGFVFFTFSYTHFRYLSGDLEHRDVDISPLLAAINIILSQHPSKKGAMVGRNRFFFPQETFRLGGGIEAWKGFYSSARPAFGTLMVNVNVATTAFYAAGNLAKAMLEFKQHTFNARVDSFVKGLRVMVSHLGHRKTVKRIATLRHEDGRSYHPTARTYRFRWDDENREVTIEQYFKISTFFFFFRWRYSSVRLF